MKLYVLQHGDAVSKETDPDRPLNEAGRAAVRSLAVFLDSRNIRVGRILHSGKTRARQTADRLERLLQAGGRLSQTDGLGPMDSPADFLSRIEGENRNLLIVSHLPFVARLVSLAITGDPEASVAAFQPSTLVVLERNDDGQWSILMMLRPAD